MALRAVRRSSGNNALDWVVTSSQIAANVSAMLPFPPTMAAATLLLAILQIITVSNSFLLVLVSNRVTFGPIICAHTSPQDIKSNQQECFRLAHRAARLLTALGRRMEGKWDDAPESLLENIREFEV